MTTTIDSLERLAKLRAEGVITDEEFEKQKLEILEPKDKSTETILKISNDFDKDKFKKRKIGIAAFTEKGRQEQLQKQKDKLTKKGWEFLNYNDKGMSSYANFLEPKGKTSKLAIGIAIIFALGVFALLLPDGDDKQKVQAPVLTQAQRIAKQEKEKQKIEQQEKVGAKVVNQMTSIINNAGMGSYISNVSLEYVASMPQLIIEVRSNWHYQPKQVRKDAAMTLWDRWAMLCIANKLGDDADSCRIKLISQSGDAVGGSRVLAGSLIYVND